MKCERRDLTVFSAGFLSFRCMYVRLLVCNFLLHCLTSALQLYVRLLRNLTTVFVLKLCNFNVNANRRQLLKYLRPFMSSLLFQKNSTAPGNIFQHIRLYEPNAEFKRAQHSVHGRLYRNCSWEFANG